MRRTRHHRAAHRPQFLLLPAPERKLWPVASGISLRTLWLPSQPPFRRAKHPARFATLLALQSYTASEEAGEEPGEDPTDEPTQPEPPELVGVETTAAPKEPEAQRPQSPAEPAPGRPPSAATPAPSLSRGASSPAASGSGRASPLPERRGSLSRQGRRPSLVRSPPVRTAWHPDTGAYRAAA
jgi:hypothetical protein